MNQLIFAGTGGGRYTMSQQLRSTAGVIIVINKKLFYLDPGPGSLLRLKQLNINPRDISCVLVSHRYIDHSNDLNAVIDAMTFGGEDQKGILVTNRSVVENPDTPLTRIHRTYLKQLMPMTQGQKVTLDNVEIAALKTKHTDPNTLGFKFSTEKFTLSYTGDTNYFSDLYKEHSGADILIINNGRPFKSKERSNQLKSEETVNLIKKANAQLAIITHFGIEMLKANPLYEAREIQKQTNVQVMAAYDGLKLDLSNYTKATRQSKLA